MVKNDIKVLYCTKCFYPAMLREGENVNTTFHFATGLGGGVTIKINSLQVRDKKFSPLEKNRKNNSLAKFPDKINQVNPFTCNDEQVWGINQYAETRKSAEYKTDSPYKCNSSPILLFSAGEGVIMSGRFARLSLFLEVWTPCRGLVNR